MRVIEMMPAAHTTEVVKLPKMDDLEAYTVKLVYISYIFEGMKAFT